MRLHLDGERREIHFCLATIVAIMVLTGSAILYMGTRDEPPLPPVARMVLASPL